MAWRLAFSLNKLRAQVNDACPKRKKGDDGTIGDSAHQSRKSDHNPNAKGVVLGMDLTHDPKGGFDSYEFAEHLRKSKDERIDYIISNGRICSSSVSPWTWRKYNGANKHDRHVHVSVKKDAKHYDDESKWDIGIVPPPRPAPKPSEPPQYVKPVAPPDVEPVDEAPKKTGISEGAIVGGGVSGADAGSQIWDAVTNAPQSAWDALVQAAQQPRFLVSVAIVGVCVFIWWQRRKAKVAA